MDLDWSLTKYIYLGYEILNVFSLIELRLLDFGIKPFFAKVAEEILVKLFVDFSKSSQVELLIILDDDQAQIIF